MDRRGFLQLVGAFAAGAALPKALAAETVARAPMYGASHSIVFRAAPLEAGRYTFSAWAKRAGESWGLFVTGFEAKGGETQVEIPLQKCDLSEPRVILGGITLELNKGNTSYDFTTCSAPDGARGLLLEESRHSRVLNSDDVMLKSTWDRRLSDAELMDLTK